LRSRPLGLADAIIDLVSTCSTLRTNGLRSIGCVRVRSRADRTEGIDDHVARRTLTTLLGSVINARANRTCCATSPRTGSASDGAAANEGLTDGDGPGDPGVVAVHALVPAATSGRCCLSWSLRRDLDPHAAY